MYPVSEEYKNAVYAPVRTVKARLTFDISDITAAGDVNSIITAEEASISNKQQLINKKREQSYNLATFEPNRFKLDGSFSFPDDTLQNNKELGFCSNILCDENGYFNPYQILNFNFNSSHSSMGLTLTFDVPNNEYATDFNITAYDGDNLVVASVDITGNILVQCTPIGQLYQYRRIEVTIKKWCKGNRRCRIAEIDFGVVRVYQDNNLIKMSLIEQLDLTTSTMPSAEFKFTVNNSNREFNILNPQGFYKFLQQRQQIKAELGVEITSAFTEYIQLGDFLLWDWTSDEGSLTASFTARTNLDLMSSHDYENLVEKIDYSLYLMAVDVFNICGITNYEIDAALQGITTNALMEKTNCKDVLQMIAIAGCCNIFVSRENKIIIKTSPLDINTSLDTIDLENAYSEPQIALDRIVKSVEVTYFTNLDIKATVSISNEGVTIGDVPKLETNTLINTEAHAINIANWILAQKNYRAIYKSKWRGNPAHELNDTITIEDGYGQNKNAIITKNDITYQGYLSANTEARGVINIVD
jgi:hypothetical protein